MAQASIKTKIRIGWREWISLPQLGITLIKAKVDTGARTSALHATDIEIYATRAGKHRVRFSVWPEQHSHRGAVTAKAALKGERLVRSSNGAAERRPVIETRVVIGGKTWPIELTLTSRDVMGFQMLLGRQAIRGHAVVDPGKSYHIHKKRSSKSRHHT
ncbi:MAG: ATP-dependent zinc protease [Gammaproteobacteria bacterium]|nr:ATP-dependent zinc protease [Gammaproteobacteria bacterium]